MKVVIYIPKKEILILFGIFLFLEPSGLSSTLPLLHEVFTALKVFYLVYAILLIMKDKISLDMFLFCLIMYHAILFISTIINGASFDEWFYGAYNQIGIAIYVIYGIKEYGQNRIAKGILLSVIIYSLISIALGEFGSDTTIFGVRTALPRYFIPVLGIVLACFSRSKDRLYKIFFLLISIYIVYFSIMQNVGTALTELIVFAIVFLLFSCFDNLISKMYWIVIAVIIINFAITLLNIQESFSWFIEGILQKELSFTGRTAIWEQAWNSFLSSPLIGNGVYGTFYAVGEEDGTFYAHNQWLNILSDGGILAFVFFICLILLSINRLSRMKNRKEKIILSSAILALMVGTIGEATFDITTGMLLLIFTYYSNNLSLNNKRKHQLKNLSLRKIKQ